jgi:predicted ester cyclase
MTTADLAALYGGYLDCLNRQAWSELGQFVHDEVSHNGRPLGLSGYREMLENDFRQIPDLHVELQLLICENSQLASRLRFDCMPSGTFLGVPVNGRRVSFTEHVFYELRDAKIWRVWSVIDKAAIEAQVSAPAVGAGAAAPRPATPA